MKTLLILGNGFDLALGMPSTFKQFGIYRRNQLKTVPLIKWTIIDLLLDSITDGAWGEKNNSNDWDWWNFEKAFKDTVINAIASGLFLGTFTTTDDYNDNLNLSSEYRLKQYKYKQEFAMSAAEQKYLLKDSELNGPSAFVIDNKRVADIDTSNNIPFFNLVLALLIKVHQYYESIGVSYPKGIFFADDLSRYKNPNNSVSRITSADEFYIRNLFPTFADIKPVLIKDLREWEKSFAEYIKLCQATSSINNLNYDTASSRFIYKVLSIDGSAQNVQILNFNYSKPVIGNSADNDFMKISYSTPLNIHGSIDLLDEVKPDASGIVIGYDYQVLLDYPDYVKDLAPFTKTFRISELNTILAKKLNNTQNNKLDYHVDKIVIVGHSLSKADDSYFRTIFDTADLYNGNVVLEYWYTDYPGRDKTLSVETENLQKINELLMRYIKTSRQVNKDNLLHKLLLENRLLLREYDINEILQG